MTDLQNAAAGTAATLLIVLSSAAAPVVWGRIARVINGVVNPLLARVQLPRRRCSR